jgi:hypothetical protein
MHICKMNRIVIKTHPFNRKWKKVLRNHSTILQTCTKKVTKVRPKNFMLVMPRPRRACCILYIFSCKYFHANISTTTISYTDKRHAINLLRPLKCITNCAVNVGVPYLLILSTTNLFTYLNCALLLFYAVLQLNMKI